MENCENCEKLSECLNAAIYYGSGTCPFFKDLLELSCEDSDDYCVVNGEAFYTLENNEIVLTHTVEEVYAYEKYDLIDGEIFLKGYMSRYFDPREGDFCGVLVDGYVANIYFDDCETPYIGWYDMG